MNLKTATLQELKDTQCVLQAAHDRIELDGFDVFSYQSCYIGRVRQAVGLRGCPSDGGAARADEDGGIELTLAFEALDTIAKRKLDAEDEMELKEDWTAAARIGRYVEKWGCNNHHHDRQAIEVFRKALTKLYREIEKREKVQASTETQAADDQSVSESHQPTALKQLPPRPVTQTQPTSESVNVETP